MAYKTGNPALNKDSFSKIRAVLDKSEAMTLRGVANKSMLLLGIVLLSGALGWQFSIANPSLAFVMLWGSLIIGFILSLIIIFKKTTAPYLAPIYAIFEGLLLGVLSQIFEMQFSGIVVQAVILTLGIFASMVIIYRLGIIKPTENFKLGVAAATGGIALYYVAFIVAGAFFKTELPLVASNSIYGIGFTLFVIVIAAFNLVLDFDFIEKGVEAQAPKYMEWYASFGLLVTLVWLYIEILRLLSKLRSR